MLNNSQDSLVILFQQAYKKLKSAVFFDKTQLILRDKIVEYESSDGFDENFGELIKIMLSGNWDEILKTINYSVFPKKLVNPDDKKDDIIITNWDKRPIKIKDPQYFIDMSVEGHILGVVWLLIVGCQMDSEIYEHSYGNRMRKRLLNEAGRPTFSPYLFEPYFQQYESWRDTALDYAQKSMNKNQGVVVLTLDFKGFFYHVDISREELFDFVKDTMSSDENKICDYYKQFAIALTEFIYGVISTYSEKIRYICPDLVEYRNVLPIGFYPSNVLSNFALKKFDDTMINGWNPIYYGRYVDDIIIVEKIEKNSEIYKKAEEGTLETKGVISYYLTNCSAWQKYYSDCENNCNNGLLVETKVKDENKDEEQILYTVNSKFNQFQNSNIVVQDSKVKIFYFNSSQTDAILNCFKKNIRQNISEFRMLPEDESIFQNDDYTEIYNLTEEEGPNKLRGVEGITLDKFSLSKYLGKYMRISGLIDDRKESKFDKELNKIFNSRLIIENYNSWEKVLEILANNEHYTTYFIFVKRIIDSVDKLETESTDLMIDDLKNTLYQILASSIARSLSLIWKDKVASLLERIEEKTSLFRNPIYDKFLKDNLTDMRLNYCQTRMCDKYAMVRLIDGYLNIDLNDSLNINLTKFEPAENLSYNYECFKDANYIFYPYLITMTDLTIHNFMMNLNVVNRNMTKSQFEELRSQYQILNYWHLNNSELEETITFKEISDIKASNIAVKVGNGKKEEIKIAVANARLFERDFERVLNGLPVRTYERYHCLTTIIKTAIKNKVDLLVLPENYLPIEWLPILARTCAKNQMAVVTGIEHIKTKVGESKPIVSNYTAIILPYMEEGYKFSYIHFHKKVHYAPHEVEAIQSHHCKVDVGDIYELYNWNDFWFSAYCCYELASIQDRAIFQSYLDALIAVEWNKDTNYYSNIIESLSRDLHCYCIQVNTSEYGDSRITQPTKTEKMDIVKVKGGINPTVLVDKINITELRKFQLKGNLLQSKKTSSVSFKHTPPNFNYDIVEQKNFGKLWDNLH